MVGSDDFYEAVIDEINREFVRGISTSDRPRAPFRWYGGKGTLANWIVPYLPKGATYVEPYAGAASVFWHLPKPYPVEVLNDIDDRIVNLYRVLQDREKFKELAHRLIWTPYSRKEFARALEVIRDPGASDVDRAWAFFVLQNQGFSGKAGTVGNWGRSITSGERSVPRSIGNWRSRLKFLTYWHNRLSRVQIDSVDALECIRYWDTPETVFYVDPPYVLSTRTGGKAYSKELTLDEHAELVRTLLSVKGKVVLSGYDHPVYKPLEEAGWTKIQKRTSSHAAGRIRGSMIRGEGSARRFVSRTETLWLNYQVPEANHLI